MNDLITRLKRRTRVAVGSTVAVLAALSVGATTMSVPASAAVPPPGTQPVTSSPDAKNKQQKKRKGNDVAPELLASTPLPQHAGPGEHTEEFDALLFSKTAAFRHSNIDEGIAAIQALGAEHHFNVTATEDSSVFTDENLEQYEVVIFLSTTGDVLTPSQQGAFERYIQAGGGYAGIHAASDTEYDWPWYGELVGAYFNNHPPGTPTATVKVEDPAHPSTAGIEPLWERTDEWYNFQSNPRGSVHVLASLDETTYTPGNGAMGNEHPIAWCHDYDGGRSWYTGMGHTEASFADPKFLDHVLGGIQSAAGVVGSDCKATLQPSFEKVALDENTSNPMELAIADDGRVFYVDRNGAVRIILPNGNVVTAGTIPVYTGQEFGMLGIALDPDFENNNWIYLYYSPQQAEPMDRLVRYTMSGNTLELDSATSIIDVPTQRDQCCHAGGALEFDKDGNLYLATGDNTNPFDSSGYTPIDERPGRSAWDAQRTSANTNSLMGKVLRIKPEPEGGYSIPEGNLFDEAEDTENKTRPEIYAMGFRNPFRIGLDEQNNNLLVADYGPDASQVSATRGPNGRVEWNVLAEPGFYGWPYCVGNNTPYNDYNFASSTAGAAFDCDNPVNDSPNNTGLTNLPPAKPAVMWQSNQGSITGTPEIGASGAPMTSGTYSFDPDLQSDRKWPAYFDRKAIWADWNNSRLFTVQMNEDGTNYTDLNRFLPSLQMRRPHALQFGPDGALYMIEWGSGFDGNNTDSGIYRIDYVEGNRAPIARVSTNQTSGPVPLSVDFDGSASFDPDTGDNTGLTYAWDFDGDDTIDSTSETGNYVYTEAGNYTARLTVTDADGRSGTTNIDITAGNTEPSVELVLPPDGGFFDFGDYLAYEVEVSDPEDGTIDCDEVIVQPGLGHDQHSHDYEQYQGCSGTLPLPGDTGHVGANIFGTIKATYTDGGAGPAGALTGVDGIILHTKHKEAEFFDDTGRTGDNDAGTPGVSTQNTSDAGGGQNVTGVETGDWFGWDVMNLTNITGLSIRAASTTEGAAFEVRQGSPTGDTIGTLTVPNTGGAQNYQLVSTELTGASTDSEPLYLVATTGGANVNWLEFEGRGVTDNQPPAVEIEASTLNGPAPLPVQFDSTVTDGDDDTPFTYEWDFGDGATSEEADPSHTYTTPGTYVVSLTVTDSRGAATTRTLEVKVRTPQAICFSGRSDDFVGDALDTERWNRNVRVNQSLTVENGTLNIPITATDIYQTSNDAPNIVLQDLPGGAFEATTLVTLPATKGYQQAGLIVYGDDDNYLKLVYSGRSTAQDGNKASNIIQFAKETNGTASESNSTALGLDFPDTVWLRMTSADGESVTASYSTDGATWLPITMQGGATAPARDLTGITSPKIGLLALGATAAAATPQITAEFDYFTLTPDDTAEPCDTGCLVEQFNGSALSGDWDTVRPSGNLVVSDGSVHIPLEGTDLYQNTNSARDIILTDLPEGPFVLTTKVSAPINRAYQSAGLLIYGDDDNYIKHVFQGRSNQPNAAQNIIQTAKELNAVAAETNTAGLGADFPTTVWLRLTSEDGEQVLGSYSTDGETWTEMAAGYDLSGIEDPRVGLLAAANQAAGAGIIASFDWFTRGPDDGCVPDDEEPTDTDAPTTEITIPPATGEDGWYVERPSFTLTASDGDGSGVASTEYRIAGGDWTPYTEAVEVPGEGERLIEYRSTDEAGNVEATKSLTVEIDTVAPSASADVTGDEAKTVTLNATDATSGVASIEYKIDDADSWSTYTDPVVLDEPGTYVVHYRATDVAGNVDTDEVEVVVPEPEEPEQPTVTISTNPEAPDGDGGWFISPVTVTIEGAGGEGELTVEQRVDDGPWTAYTEPIVISTDGTTQVQARVTDEEGTESEVATTTVNLDATAPTVTVSGIANNGKLKAAAVRTVGVTSEDATSGVLQQTVRLDGKVVDAPVKLDALELKVGKHRLVVTTTDEAGNVTTREVTFTVVASYAGAKQLVKRLQKEKAATAGLAKKLKKQVQAAKKADKAGKTKKARKALNKFAKLAKKVKSADGKAALKKIARALKKKL